MFPSPTPVLSRLSVQPRSGVLGAVRAWVRAWARSQGVGADALALVATELVANAIDASRSDRPVEVELRADDTHVELVVVDAGAGFVADTAPPVHDRPPPASQHRGRGLFVVGALVDEFHLARRGDRTVATARLSRRGSEPGPDDCDGPVAGSRRSRQLRR
jgi:anti-sigma regulatory factor (Ser/Thr protein kinase)